jgi:hypothetical protein
MSTYLKIKIASLAAEARIIRNEEHKLLAKHRKWKAKAESRKGAEPPALFFSIEQHRKQVVRGECRAAHLAQGYIRGTAYRANATPAGDALKAWRESSEGLRVCAA